MKPKSNSVVTVQQDGDLIHWDVLGAGRVTLDTRKISAANMQYAAFHGLKQRGSDGAAISRDPETGKPATPADKQAAIQEIVTHLESGTDEWRMVGVGGGGKSITIEAVARVKGVTYDEAEKYVDDYATRNYEGDRKECLAFLREGKRVMEAMAAIRAERAPKPKVDADKALDDLKAE